MLEHSNTVLTVQEPQVSSMVTPFHKAIKEALKMTLQHCAWNMFLKKKESQMSRTQMWDTKIHMVTQITIHSLNLEKGTAQCLIGIINKDSLVQTHTMFKWQWQCISTMLHKFTCKELCKDMWKVSMMLHRTMHLDKVTSWVSSTQSTR